MVKACFKVVLTEAREPEYPSTFNHWLRALLEEHKFGGTSSAPCLGKTNSSGLTIAH